MLTNHILVHTNTRPMAKTTDTAMWPHPLVVCGRLFSRLLVLDRLTYIYIFSFYMNTCNLVWEPPITAAIISELRFTAASTHFKQIMPPNDIGSREQTRACLSVGNYDGCRCHPQSPFCQSDATDGQSLSQSVGFSTSWMALLLQLP